MVVFGHLRSGVVAVSGLNHEAVLLDREMDLPITGARFECIGRVADVVLIAEFFLDIAVDLFDRLFLGHFKKAAAGLFGKAFENLLAIRALDVAAAWIAAAATTHAAYSGAAEAAQRFVIREQNGIHQRVGALSRFNRAGQADLAAIVYAVGEQDERLPATLLPRDFIAGEQNGIV